MEVTRARRNRRTLSAVLALNTYQTDYPDYDQDDWLHAVEDAFTLKSVRAVSKALTSLSDWSLRGIAVSQEDLAKSASVSKLTVQRAIRQMSDAGYLLVSKRPARKTPSGFAQYPNVYRLVIPKAPTWDMPFIPPGTDATDIPLYAADAPDLFPWEKSPEDAAADRAYWDQINRLALGDGEEDTKDTQTPHAWTWVDTRWTTQSNGPSIVATFLNYSDADAVARSDAWPETMISICPTCKQPHMSDGLCSWCLDDD